MSRLLSSKGERRKGERRRVNKVPRQAAEGTTRRPRQKSIICSPGPCRPLNVQRHRRKCDYESPPALACLFVVATASLLFGQGGANGTILGTVTDNSGAVVANAKVDIINIGTGVTSHTQTSADGISRFAIWHPELQGHSRRHRASKEPWPTTSFWPSPNRRG